MAIASTLLSESFPDALRKHLDAGLSFPVAREAALTDLGYDSTLLKSPNNILAVEYCKAILSQKASMKPMPILRGGSYHDELPDNENPSATAVRSLMLCMEDWKSYIPESAISCLESAPLHHITAGERAVLMKLRTMGDEEFESLPYGSEGLWRKFMHACRKEATLEAILTAVKSKRYTRTRLDRMMMCAVLGITQEVLAQDVPYVRALAFNDRGREILKQARQRLDIFNIGQSIDHPYASLEARCDDLYGLFALDTPEPPGANSAYRVFCQEANK
jgi:predicted nucleotidyltransferase